MRKALAILLVLLVVSVSGCIGTSTQKASTTSSPAKSGSSAGYITVQDSLGRTVKVPTNVTRVVALGPGALRILVYLNATKDVVGIEEFEKRFPYFKSSEERPKRRIHHSSRFPRQNREGSCQR